MKILTEDADIRCDHRGKIKVETSQKYVTIGGRLILVEPDPVGRSISMCPNFNLVGMKPCMTTLTVPEGYSPLISVDGRRVVLDSLQGLTDGTPPGIVNYKVIDPGQTLVDVA